MSLSYGYSYLTSYGWTGTGNGLRNGAIAKPLAIPPKKNLNGLGKDRDEAFPFWDQCVLLGWFLPARRAYLDAPSLFTAASKAITIKLASDDEDADETEVSRFHRPLHPVSTQLTLGHRIHLRTRTPDPCPSGGPRPASSPTDAPSMARPPPHQAIPHRASTPTSPA